MKYLKCYNQKCLHEWKYKGKATDDKDTLTCPKCLYKLTLGKAIIKKSEIPNLPNLPNELPNLPNELPNEKLSEIPSFQKKSKNEIQRNYIDESLASTFCKKHGLPAIYNSSEKRFKCNKCFEEEIEINCEYTEVTSHLGSVKKIESPIQEIKQIPFTNAIPRY